MEITVGKLNEYIKQMFEYEPMLRNVSVRGEVSNVKYHQSGHIYFTIKDNIGQLACVMFYGQRAGLKFKLETGQSIVVTGRVSVYERDGKYQMYASLIEKDGVGKLYEEFEKLKVKLGAEGLFDDGHKKRIPRYAMRIGVVTSAQAAALADICNVARQRNPFVTLYLCPVQVQGAGAAATIANGIKKLDGMGMDVIIVARGGGSMEDLWAFNEEIVARACYECNTPVISGVGHETDTTIIDYVSDFRAPTPTAAATAAVFDYNQFVADTRKLKDSFDRIMNNAIYTTKLRCDNYLKRLERAGVQAKLDGYKMTSDRYYEKLHNLVNKKINESKRTIGILSARLEGVSPLKKLGQGYSYTTTQDNKKIKSIDDVKDGDDIIVTLFDGNIEAKVTGKEHIELSANNV